MTMMSPANEADDIGRLIEERWSLVHRICVTRVRSSDVDDAVQDTFIQLLLADRRRIINLDAWLIVVALRVCFRIHRGRYRAEEVPFDVEHDITDDAGLEDVLDSQWFARLCADLSNTDRALLDSLYVHPRPRRAVAADLGVTTSHLRVIAFRARRRAQAVIEALDLLERGA